MLGALLVAGMASAASCNCANTFDEVTRAVEGDYAGYLVKVPDARAREVYTRFRDLLVQDVRDARTPAQCHTLIDAYLDYFADDHLFVTNVSSQPGEGETPGTEEPAAAADARQAAAPDLPQLKARWTPDKVEFRLRRETDLDPVEGLWRDAEGQLAIVHDDALERGQYAAFRFRQHYFGGAGEMLALIRPANDGSYRIHYKDANGVWQKTRALLNNETGVLNFGGIGWQRTTKPATPTGKREDPSLPAAEVNLPSAADPLAPVFRDLGDQIHYLAVPSFLPRFREPLQALLSEHAEQLSDARGLVVDLRGNSGGDAIHSLLAPYLMTGPVKMAEASGVRASRQNIEYIAQTDELTVTDRDALLARMRANPGRIVPFRDAQRGGPEKVIRGPRQVVVLQDRGVGGEAEAFLLQVRQSERVITMGEASKGNVDYRHVVRRELGCGDYALSLGYPLIMRSRDLPAGSIDDSGIVPDVRLSPAFGDWVKYAERWLRAETEPAD